MIGVKMKNQELKNKAIEIITEMHIAIDSSISSDEVSTVDVYNMFTKSLEEGKVDEFFQQFPPKEHCAGLKPFDLLLIINNGINSVYDAMVWAKSNKPS